MKCLHGNGWCDYFDLTMTDNCAKGDPPDVENCQLYKNRQTSEAVVPLNDLLCLKLRNAIADKEFVTASANMDIQQYGKWHCDWNRDMQEADAKVQELIAKIEA